MSFFAGKKIFLLGFLVVLLFAVPLTVFLTQQSQQVTTQASPSTTLSFTPTSKAIGVGETAVFDVMMNPGTNSVSFAKLVITHDPTKLSVDPATGVTPNPVFTVLQGPVDAPCPSNPSLNCLTVTLSVGANPAAVITTPTKLITLTLKGVIASTATLGTDTTTQVLSVGSGDQANENVLTGPAAPATVTVGGGAGGAGTSSPNKSPVCTSLVLDRSATGAAPYSLTFTASGNDSDGTITKVNFTFGDGQTSTVSQSGGIGTNSVNSQVSHTYNNAGTFNASATLTDNGNSTSTTTTCATTITVTAATAGSGGSTVGTGGSTGTGSVTTTPTAVPTEVIPLKEFTPTPTIAPTGPGDTIISIGAVGIMLSILGALLLAF